MTNSSNKWLHLLKTSLEVAAHGVMITDRSGTVLWVNPEFCRMTGYERDEMVGGDPSVLRSGVQDDAFYRELWSTILSGATWRGEIINRRKDGSLYPERQSIQPVSFHSSEITNFIAIKEDISEKEQLRARLRKTERLETIQKLAAGLAHQINNPLTYIRANLEYLSQHLIEDRVRDAISSEEIQEIFEETIEGTRRIEQILTDLNTLAQDDRTIPVHAIDVTQALELAMHFTFGDEWSRFICAGDAHEIYALANQARLVEIFSHVLENAQEALDPNIDMPDQIRVSTHRRGDDVVVEIADSGRGIPPDAMSMLFEPFYSTKSGAQGLGLGLVICKDIVERLDGAIEVESKPGAGSTFRIIVPAADKH